MDTRSAFRERAYASAVSAGVDEIVGRYTANHAARLALVIGNDQYQAIEKLKNAKNDANLMASVLRKAGFQVTQANDLAREGLWSTLDNFKARIGKGDEVVFFFARHGVQIGSTQLLLPIDIKAQTEGQVQRDGVPMVGCSNALFLPHDTPNTAEQGRNTAPDALKSVFGCRLRSVGRWQPWRKASFSGVSYGLPLVARPHPSAPKTLAHSRSP